MTPDYSPISLKHAEDYITLLHICGNNASDYSFANIWGWADHFGLEWRLHGGLCWIRQTIPRKRQWSPVGCWEKYDWNACENLAQGHSFFCVPEKLLQTWQAALPPGRLRLTDLREHWDYLYNLTDLVELSGNRFHKKKNLLNQFKKNHEYVYSPLCAGCIEEILDMQNDWIKWQEVEKSSPLLLENAAIWRVLTHWGQIPGLIGGSIRIDGKVVAYTVGEKLNKDAMVVHFEKGMPGYKGVYQAVNNFFAREVSADPDITYINREQDMGDDGLRKAKESYNPIAYVKKYCVDILPAAHSAG